MPYNNRNRNRWRYSKGNYSNDSNYNRGNYNNYNNYGYNRGNYRKVTDFSEEKRQFRGVKDLNPEPKPKPESARASLTIGQIELLKAILTFIKDKDTIKADELGVTEEEINMAHKVLTMLYSAKLNNNVPDKEYWKNFFAWLVIEQGQEKKIT